MKRLLLLFAVLSTAVASAAIPAMTPKSRGDADGWWMKRHAAKVAEAKAGGAPVVFIGDSITHRWEGKDAWERFFATGRYRAMNLGYGGDCTENLYWRIENGELDGFEAKAVVLMIGTNNTGLRSPSQEPPADTFLAIRGLIAKIRAKQPKATLVLHPIFSRGAGPDDAFRQRNALVSEELIKLCDGRTVVWCDFNSKFLAQDGSLSRTVMPDLLHPNQVGYEIWAASLLPVLERIFDGKDPVGNVCDSAFAAGVTLDRGLAASRDKVTGVHHAWWLDRLQQNREFIAAKTDKCFDLVMLGDSITHRWENQAVASYAQLTNGLSVLNCGYGGDSIQNLLWRIENGELDGYMARNVMVMIGTNNEDSFNPDEIYEGIEKVISVVERKQPAAKITIVGLLPRRLEATSAYRAVVKRVNERLRCFSTAYQRITYFDFTTEFLNEDGSAKAGLLPDGIHPSEAGYEVWLKQLNFH